MSQCISPLNECQCLVGSCAQKLCPRENMIPFQKDYWKKNNDTCNMRKETEFSVHKEKIEGEK